MIKKIFILFSFVLLGKFSYGQIVTTNPEIPTPNDSVTIFFHADEGNQELMDYEGDIWAHTGVITEESSGSSDWKYVVAGWDENKDKARLKQVETNLYKLEIEPSIREYYGVPEGDTIKQMAFVFRNSDGSLEGKTTSGEDIFVDVSQSTFNVKLIQPEEKFTFQSEPQTFDILGIGSSDSVNIDLSLLINDQQVKNVTADTILHTFSPDTSGRYTISLTGTDRNENDTVHKTLMVNPEFKQQERPDGLKDGITYVDESTVRLSLFAPYKDFAYVLGDFNDWQLSKQYFMKKDSVNPDSVYYWTEISGLDAGREYAFQYWVDGEIRVADPYSEKILDPDNDQYITEETYPNLKSYPAGKTEKITGVLQPGKSEYEWKTENYQRPAKETLVIYELLIRDFIEEHDYETLIDSLDYLDRLGVNAIELMPVMEFDANISWGYNPTFHMAVDKYYGPARDLKRFIDECHSRGIAVILDMVLNHAWGPSPLVRLWNEGDYGKPLSENPYLNVEPRHDFNVGYDFNHESAATQHFVDRVNRYWLREFRFDGFRFDLSKGFTQKNTLGNVSAWGQFDASRVRILKRMADEIWKSDESAYIILEHFAGNEEEKELSEYGMALWGNMNRPYSEASMGYHDNGKSDFSEISYKARNWEKPNLVGYMESHDEERIMYKNLQYGNSAEGYDITEEETALERIEAAAAMFFTVPGPKMVWQFGELGYEVSIDYNGRTDPKPLRWNYLEENSRRELFNVFSELIRLKQEHEVFNTSDFSLSVVPPVKKLTLKHASMDVIVVANFDVVSRSFKPGFTTSGLWYEYFSSDTLDVSNVSMEISLEPGEYRLYSTEKIDQLNPPLGNSHLEQLYNGDFCRVYPNPSRGNFRFEFSLEKPNEISLSVFDLSGKKVEQITGREYGEGTHMIHLNLAGMESGLYFYRLTAGNKHTKEKLIKH